MRSYLPTPLQPLLQFHAWWHVLAGYNLDYLIIFELKNLIIVYSCRYATYLNIQHCLHHRLTYLQKNVIISTDWCGVNVRTRSPEPNNNKIKACKRTP